MDERAGVTKTLLAVYMGGAPEHAAGSHRIPVYSYPESAALALSKAVEYARWRSEPEGEMIRPEGIDKDAAAAIVRDALVDAADDPEGVWLAESEIQGLLGAYGIELAGSATAFSEDEAVEIAAGHGGPVVLKVVAPSVLHKSDMGGVILGVDGEQEVREAYRAVTSIAEDAVGAVVSRSLSPAAMR